jgi:hypothetical protein
MNPTIQSYFTDRIIADSRMSMVKKTLGLACFKVSSFSQDVKKATDLIPFIKIDQLAVRVRNCDAIKYAGEITIRCGRTTTPLTEFHKICEGNASHMFYGIMNTDNASFFWWVLIDLVRFRCLLQTKPELLNAFSIIPNRDAQSCFMAIPLKTIPECVVHSSVYLENLMKNKIYEAACP